MYFHIKVYARAELRSKAGEARLRSRRRRSITNSLRDSATAVEGSELFSISVLRTEILLKLVKAEDQVYLSCHQT